jgi:hypothetical protein
MAALAFQRTRKTRRHRVRRGITGTERRCDWDETHQGGAGLHGLTAGSGIRTTGPSWAEYICLDAVLPPGGVEETCQEKRPVLEGGPAV